MRPIRNLTKAHTVFAIALSVTLLVSPLPALAQSSTGDSTLRSPSTTKPSPKKNASAGPGSTLRPAAKSSSPMPLNENPRNLRKEVPTEDDTSEVTTSDNSDAPEIFYWQSGGTSSWRRSPRIDSASGYNSSQGSSTGIGYQRTRSSEWANDYSPNGPSNAAKGRHAFNFHVGWPYYEFGYLYSVSDKVSTGFILNSFWGASTSVAPISSALKWTIKFSVSRRGPVDVGFRINIGYYFLYTQGVLAQGYISEISLLIRRQINNKISIVPSIDYSNRALFIDLNMSILLTSSFGMAIEFAIMPRLVLYFRASVGGGFQILTSGYGGTVGFAHFESTVGLGYAF